MGQAQSKNKKLSQFYVFFHSICEYLRRVPTGFRRGKPRPQQSLGSTQIHETQSYCSRVHLSKYEIQINEHDNAVNIFIGLFEWFADRPQFEFKRNVKPFPLNRKNHKFHETIDSPSVASFVHVFVCVCLSVQLNLWLI